MQIQTANIPEISVRPAGAAMIPTRPWSQLTQQEKLAIMGIVADRHARGMGSPTVLSRSGVAGPIPAELRGTITQTAWDDKTEEEQVEMVRAARERAAQQATAGFTFGTGLANATRDVITEFMRGETQREITRLTATARTNDAQARLDADRHIANTNLQIADLNLAAARARSSGDSGGLAQIAATIRGLTDSQNAAREIVQNATGLSTGAMVGIGVGVVAVLGLGLYVATRRR